MSQVLLEAIPKQEPLPGDVFSSLFRFHVDQYQQLIDLGMLKEGAPWELLDGMILHKNRADAGEDEITHGPEHANHVARLTGLLVRIAEQLGLSVRCQLPLQLSPKDAPEPDFSLVRPLTPQAVRRHPHGDEVALVIEVASSSLKFNRSQKQKVYATAGIPEYWIINLVAKKLEDFQKPDVQIGSYQTAQVLDAADQITAN